MSYYKQKEKITLKIVPHTKKDIFSLQISKKIIKLLVLIGLSSLCVLVGTLYYYYYSYHVSLENLEKMNQIKDYAEKLEEKNCFLSDELSNLTDEVEVIKERFSEIVTQNQRIKKMVNFNNSLSSNINFEENISRNIGYYDLSDASNRKVIKYTQANLNMLSDIFPKEQKDLHRLKNDVLRYKDYLASKPKGWPIEGGKGQVVSGFGYRMHPILKKRLFHEGIDISIWYNHKVTATGKGKVIYAGVGSGYGRFIIIDHGYGYRTLYAHNNRLLVRAGDYVKRGDVISLSGNSGRSTGPHLHYEIQVNKKPVDPMDYIK